MNEQEMVVTVSYDWDRVTPNDVTTLLRAMPGVIGVTAGSVDRTPSQGSGIRWQVQDNVTGEAKSMSYDDRELSINICAGLNTPDAGGRYGVYVNEGDGWRRDLE